jgi:putative SOS response-associated peptidase YedK
MLITEPNRFVAEVHDRMPVILKPDSSTPGWTDPWAVEEIKTPIADSPAFSLSNFVHIV